MTVSATQDDPGGCPHPVAADLNADTVMAGLIAPTVMAGLDPAIYATPVVA